MPIVHQTHSCRFALVCGYIFHKVQEFMWKPSRSTGAAYERLGDAGWLLLGAEGSSKQATVAAAGWLTPTLAMGSLPLLLVESDSLGPIFFAPTFFSWHSSRKLRYVFGHRVEILPPGTFCSSSSSTAHCSDPHWAAPTESCDCRLWPRYNAAEI